MPLAADVIRAGFVEILIIAIVIFGPGVVNFLKWVAEQKRRVEQNARRGGRALSEPPAAAPHAPPPPPPVVRAEPRPHFPPESRYELPPMALPPQVARPEPVVVLQAPPPPPKKKRRREGQEAARAAAAAAASAIPEMGAKRRQTLGQAMRSERAQAKSEAGRVLGPAMAGLTEAQRLFVAAEVFAAPLALRPRNRASIPVREFPGADRLG